MIIFYIQTHNYSLRHQGSITNSPPPSYLQIAHICVFLNRNRCASCFHKISGNKTQQIMLHLFLSLARLCWKTPRDLPQLSTDTYCSTAPPLTPTTIKCRKQTLCGSLQRIKKRKGKKGKKKYRTRMKFKKFLRSIISIIFIV